MSDALEIGALFAGRYRIEALLGEGGMGAVYRAEDEHVGDVIALKTLVSRLPDAEGLERFRREVRLARKITHPNVARIHDLGEHDGVHYLTMEYVRGRDLQHVTSAEAPVSPARAAELLVPVAEALAAIHRAGIVHRDLKPANVLVEDGGRVVLTDFGIARADADRAASFRTSGPIGTPLYMAPEQVTGKEVTPRSDIYALGLMIYELLVGEVPFLGPSPIATALARLQGPVPDPRERVSVPDALADLVVACLARDPADRPATAEQVAAVLASLSSASPRTPSPLGMMATMVAPSTPPPRADTVSPGGRALAVLPFRYRGPDDHDYLGDALTEELIDLLSTTRGLRVLASGATQRYREERDPLAVGRDLGVDALVDGTVQAAANRVRVTARLCDARTGTQVWNDRFEGPLEDVFELQDRLARRIAESLRVGLNTTTSRGDTPAEAIEAYLRARKMMRFTNTSFVEPGGVVELLETCIELAPDFGPALAAHAMATVRAWFIPGLGDRNWEQVARASLDRAIQRALASPRRSSPRRCSRSTTAAIAMRRAGPSRLSSSRPRMPMPTTTSDGSSARPANRKRECAASGSRSISTRRSGSPGSSSRESSNCSRDALANRPWSAPSRQASRPITRRSWRGEFGPRRGSETTKSCARSSRSSRRSRTRCWSC